MKCLADSLATAGNTTSFQSFSATMDHLPACSPVYFISIVNFIIVSGGNTASARVAIAAINDTLLLLITGKLVERCGRVVLSDNGLDPLPLSAKLEARFGGLSVGNAGLCGRIGAMN